jgi:hypothetical protein
MAASDTPSTEDTLRDLALPPGLHLGRLPDGTLAVVNQRTQEVVGLTCSPDDAPKAVLAVWREYLQTAPDVEIARIVHLVLATGFLAEHAGEIHGGPRNRRADSTGRLWNYECLFGEKDDGGSIAGHDDDLVFAILKARRVLLESLDDMPAHDPDDEMREDD